ncbi:glycosyltransferase involved in cell wall biosynthesis [Sphingomonas insulae]|uniref:Glycosyltransferase family 4 protein n=1 Tax=Sphingomonas insulae TaxID=424800 RepID=A0ABP3T1T9_9SPHN|nr:glycosyltransferase [Sphingomonas insulae]NIJ29078.1 glycosyltransferase involved in cell wall biosynthesis [Sphingomonas insulae]
MLRVLTLSTLFPDATRPNFGIFVERQTAGLAARDGVEVRVVAPIGLPPGPLALIQHADKRSLPEREAWRGLDVYRPRFTSIPGVGGRWHARQLQHALEPLFDAIRRDFAFDVIDASFFFPDGPAAVALGARYGVPVSIKARGADIHHWGTGGPTAAQVVAAGQAADGVLAVSGAMRADMMALGIPGERIRVHHTGVDLDRFRPVDRVGGKAELGIAGPLVLSLGALIPRKGQDLVVRAVATLPDVTLAIVGEGAERARLTALAEKLGVGHRVRFLGSVAHDSLPAIIGAADVMALASTSEGLANAWVESLACGTPIVITDAGGAREVVTTRDAGRIVPSHPVSIAAAIGELLVHPPEPAAVRAAALPFTWAANTAALHDHLSGLVARGRRRTIRSGQASRG